MKFGVEDTVYYCIAPRNNSYKIWVFDDFSHFFPKLNGTILGKPVYYHPHKAPQFNLNDYKRKIINYEEYFNLIYKKNSEKLIKMNSSYEIKKIICKEIPDLNRPHLYSNDVFAKSFVAFDKNDIVEISSPKPSLLQVLETNNKVQKTIQNIQDILEVPDNQLGITGSLALGASTYNDIDLVIYGNQRELNRIMNIIRTQIEYYGAVIENGLKWPCRFRDKHGRIICCFFNILNENYLDPVVGKSRILSPQKTSFLVRVSDDSYSIAKTPLLFLDKGDYDALLIWSRGFRGVFRNGDIISGTGFVLDSENSLKTIVCFDPFSSIYNWASYFNR